MPRATAKWQVLLAARSLGAALEAVLLAARSLGAALEAVLLGVGCVRVWAVLAEIGCGGWAVCGCGLSALGSLAS